MGEDASLRVNCEGRAITVSRPSSLSVLMAGALKQAIFLVRRGRAEQAVNLSVQTGGEVKHPRGGLLAEGQGPQTVIDDRMAAVVPQPSISSILRRNSPSREMVSMVAKKP